MPPERVKVWTRRRFDSEDFEPSQNEFKDVLILPEGVFERLFETGRSGYAWVTYPESGVTLRVYVLPFSSARENGDSGPPDAYLRSGLQERLGIPEHANGQVVELEPIDEPDSGELELVRFSTKTESTRDGECRAHPSVLNRIGVGDGGDVELYNPENGGRLLATIRAEKGGMEPGEISLSTHGRKLLRVELAERAADDETTVVHARPAIQQLYPTRRDGGSNPEIYERVYDRLRTLPRRSKERVLDWAVGYHEVHLRVHLGLNTDEGRETARVNSDIMDALAIEDGDRVLITSQSGRTSAHCHLIEPDGHLVADDNDIHEKDVQDRTILLPSTVREKAGVTCDDVVTVRRDTSYIAARQIVLSMFGFLGVFVGATQSIDLLIPPQYQLHAFVVALLLSASSIWLVLWPERQRCH